LMKESQVRCGVGFEEEQERCQFRSVVGFEEERDQFRFVLRKLVDLLYAPVLCNTILIRNPALRSVHGLE
jgi:hypothetical protein